MGLPNNTLFATKLLTSDELLLTTYKPIKKEDGKYYTPQDQPIGGDLWIRNTFGFTEEMGIQKVSIEPTDEDTGLWVICFNDYFGDELHLYNTKPRWRKTVDSNFFSRDVGIDREYRKKNSHKIDTWDLHMSIPSLNHMKAGDGPISVTLKPISE